LNAAGELVERGGLDPVVVGGLSTSKLFDVGTAVYATSASAKRDQKENKFGACRVKACGLDGTNSDAEVRP